jgi:peptidyl-prolyl cis-trans isomerase C/foldase protein PrsA
MPTRTGAAWALAVLAAGCTWFDEPVTDDAVVRFAPKVEGRAPLVITAAELRRSLARRRVQLSGDLDAPPLPPEVQSAVLDELIEIELFSHHAQQLGLTVSSTTVDAELDVVISGLPKSELQRTLNATYQTAENLEESIRQRLMLRALLAREVDPNVSKAELKARWNATDPAEKMRPPRVRAAQIVVASEQTARQVRKRLRGGEAFEELAMEHSVTPNAPAGGYLGWFARKEMPEVIDETCFELEPGKVSDIVPSEYGYHIFKVYERTEGQPITFAEARPELERSIMDDRLRTARNRLRARLEDEWTMTRNEAAIKEVFQWGR